MIKTKSFFGLLALLAAVEMHVATLWAAAPKATATQLIAAGQKFEAQYSDLLGTLQAEITKALPAVPEQKKVALETAREAVKQATAEANASQEPLGKIQTARALVEHAKGKWIGGAEKGIAAAEAALNKATTAAEREAAQKDLAQWQANKQDGLKALKERQEALDRAKIDESQLSIEKFIGKKRQP